MVPEREMDFYFTTNVKFSSQIPSQHSVFFYGKTFRNIYQKIGFQDTLTHLPVMREAEDAALGILECWGVETFPKTIT